jgi:branched-subunit amino acid transport protein
LTAFLVTLAVGVGTYITRAVFILALAKKRIPDHVLVALSFVGPAVLGALVIAVLIDGDGQVAIGVPEAVALLVGGLVAYKTRSHILTLVVGMVVFWVLRALV